VDARHQKFDPTLSLYHLLDPGVLENPYPLYQRLRTEAPVHWDPFLHTWVVTRYADVVTVLTTFSANRATTPEQMQAMKLEALAPLAQVMVKQLIFLDPPAHTRLRRLASAAFTPRRVEGLRVHIQQIVDDLIDAVEPNRHIDVIEDLAYPLPAIITAEMLGVSPADRDQLKLWSADFAEVLGNFQHNPDRMEQVMSSLLGMQGYYTKALQDHREHPRDDLMGALLAAEMDGDRFTDEEIIANCILIMVAGQETTTNLIGNSMLTLLRHPDQLAWLRADLTRIPVAVEELMRFESPSQITARVAQEDMELGGKLIRQRQAVIALVGAANRDPERFPDPDTLDLARQDNRHVAFGWGSHFCFGAPLARLEGQIALATLLKRIPQPTLDPVPLVWRENLGLRGLVNLGISW
jgi:pimeloyl-[acyl-carrier protein] synthase